jgi:hypothetical protein
VTCCALCSNILPSSPTTSFSLLWRGVSLLYETRTTPGRVLNSRAVQQGQPRTKRGLCLALVGALELISAADWNILISLLYLGLGDSRVSTSLVMFSLNSPICKVIKQSLCAWTPMVRTVFSPAPLSGAAPFLRTYRQGWGSGVTPRRFHEAVFRVSFPPAGARVFVITGRAKR